MIETLGFRVEVKDIKVFDDDDHDNRDNDDDKEDEDNKDNHIGVNKDDNDEKGISALGLDRDLGFLQGHQIHQRHRLMMMMMRRRKRTRRRTMTRTTTTSRKSQLCD